MQYPHSYRRRPYRPPDLLKQAIPVTGFDVDSGELVRFVDSFGRYPELKKLGRDALRRAVAFALGYESFEALATLRGNMAGEADLPNSPRGVLDVISWRLFETRACGLANAFLASLGAWQSHRLALHAVFGETGFRKPDLQLPLMDPPSPLVELSEDLPAPDSVVLEGSNLILGSRVEEALELARYMWTPDSSVTLDDVREDALRGASIDIGDAVEASWHYSTQVWPPGLLPLEYLDADGDLVGYGFRWPECGCRHARIFGDRDAFRLAAVALWQRQPTAEFALSELPEKVVSVPFDNPWMEEAAPVRSESTEAMSDLERADREGPEVAFERTNGASVDDGFHFEFDGEPFTRNDHTFHLCDIEGRFGLSLMSPELVAQFAGYEPWLEAKIPYAFSAETYDIHSRVWTTLHAIGRAESAYLGSTNAEFLAAIEVQDEYAALAALTAIDAKPTVAKASQQWMQGTLGMVAHCDVPLAGHLLGETYPELAPIGLNRLGEYALAYYGKNELRRGKAISKRDPSFLAYAFMRNLGLDPPTTPGNGWFPGVQHLLRRHVRDNPECVSDRYRRRFELECKDFVDRIREICVLADNLGDGDTSRMHWVATNGAELREQG